MKELYKTFFIAFLIISCQSQTITPKDLRTDLLRNPDHVKLYGKKQEIELTDSILGKGKYEISKIQSENPLFNWTLDNGSNKSISFQVLVSSSRELIDKNIGNFWDTGKIYSDAISILYSGKKMEADKVYYWKVRYWENENKVSKYSAAQAFVINKSPHSDKFSQETLISSDQSANYINKVNKNKIFIDFEKAAFSKLKIRLSSTKKDSIKIAVGEMKKKDSNSIDSAPGSSIRYFKTQIKLNKGIHWYNVNWPENPKRSSNRFMINMPDYIGEVYPFRYLEIENYKGKLNKDDIIRTNVNYTFDENASSFISSDSILNKVWELCKYSMKATSFCGYYVDGDRERIPYEADAFINQLSHYAVDAEYGIARGSMKHLLFNPTWPTEWTLYNILMAWYDYLYTGDKRFIVKYYDELKVKTLFDLSDETGLISTLNGKQTNTFFKKLHKKHWGKNNNLRDITDWPQAKPPGGYDNLKFYIGSEKEYPGENDGFVYQKYNSVVNALLYGCLNIMEKIAIDLDKKQDAIFYKNRYEKLKRSYLELFQDPSNGLINDGHDTRHKSQHANMFALAFGLIPKKNILDVVRYVKSKNMSCSVYGSQILLESLFDNGGSNHAIDLMRSKSERSWYNMIRYGSTITMEAWDKRYKPNLDLNHAWGGSPANIIVRKMMGVEPLSPGAKTIKINPRIGTLNFANLKTSFISGDVHVKCKQSVNNFIIEATIPGGIKANISVTANKGNNNLYLNGKLLDLEISDNQYHLTDITTGKYLIEVK